MFVVLIQQGLVLLTTYQQIANVEDVYHFQLSSESSQCIHSCYLILPLYLLNFSGSKVEKL
jgi:hypothetical protein